MFVGAKNEVSGIWGSFERAVLFDLQASAEFLGYVKPLRFKLRNTSLPLPYWRSCMECQRLTLEAWGFGFRGMADGEQCPKCNFIEPEVRLWDILRTSP